MFDEIRECLWHVRRSYCHLTGPLARPTRPQGGGVEAATHAHCIALLITSRRPPALRGLRSRHPRFRHAPCSKLNGWV
jgi:hypothetical protein